ncbi:MAG: hypothetical protein SVM80_03315 [Halobacteriota archaeon]|nr:hypothetical protein [Halobacteriota archaeon]
MYNKKITGLSVAILMLTVVAIPSTALAIDFYGFSWGWGREDVEKELEVIEDGIESLENDAKKMRFLYLNMDETGIDIVRVVIVDRDGDPMKTLYLINHQGVYFKDEIFDEDIINDQTIPTAKPTIKQMKRGLELLQGDKITFGKMIGAWMLYNDVETENVPPIGDIIGELDWINSYPSIERMVERLL